MDKILRSLIIISSCLMFSAVAAQPLVSDDSARTLVGTAVNIPILVNDGDLAGLNPNSVQLIDPSTSMPTSDPVTIADEGLFEIGSDGSIRFEPEASFFGTTMIDYTVDNLVGVTSSTATVVITTYDQTGMFSVPPTAVGDSASTVMDVAVSIDVITNDREQAYTPIISNFDTTSLNGAIIVFDDNDTTSNLDDRLIYTPAAGFIGLDTFSYSVSRLTEEDSATVLVRVIDPNDDPLPVARPSAASARANQAVTFSTSFFLQPDLEIDSFGQGANGTVEFDDQGTSNTFDDQLIFNPAPNFAGVDVFTYTVIDSSDQTATSTLVALVGLIPVEPEFDFGGSAEGNPGPLFLLINGVLENPVALPFEISGNATLGEDYQLSNPVLIPAGEYDGTLATAVEVSLVVLDDDVVEPLERITFDFGLPPAPLTPGDANGDRLSRPLFTYQIIDDDNAPTARDDSSQTTAGNAVRVNVASNDDDLDGNLDPATTQFASGGNTVFVANEGTFSIADDGQIIFEPVADFLGESSVEYVIFDSAGNRSNIAVLSVTVIGELLFSDGFE